VQDLVDGLAGEAILRSPDIVAVLVDMESGIQSQGAAAAYRIDARSAPARRCNRPIT
jgi:hypothetical protein